jgi:uncharacterized membrane protein YgcG
VPGGDAFTAVQRHEIAKGIRDAERISGRRFSVHVGPSSGDPREYASRLHGQLADPANSVLIHVDPPSRAVEVVTGGEVRRVLPDRQAALATISMQAAFATGDLTRGILGGLQYLAGAARGEVLLHTDTP